MSGRILHCLITGGSSGIGLATARTMLREGWRVTIVDRQPLLHPLVGNHAEFRQADITETAEFTRQVPKFLDAVVLCAAEGPFHKVGSTVLGTNAIACLQNALACETRLRNGGAVVFIGSTAGHRVPFTPWMRRLRDELFTGNEVRLARTARALDGQAAYRASKRIIHESMMLFARRFAERAIRVNCVVPGLTLTPMSAQVRRNNPAKWRSLLSEAPFGRPNTPAEVARLIAFLCDRRSQNLTGSLIHLDSGWYVSYAS